MKILSIRLKNLASIEGYFEIDFTTKPLASAGIFAISGPTGAGKSTILDALCLALYDKTPRFTASNESLYLKDVGDSQVNQSDAKNILRRGVGGKDLQRSHFWESMAIVTNRTGLFAGQGGRRQVHCRHKLCRFSIWIRTKNCKVPKPNCLTSWLY